jgi:hypothetical protein
MAAETQLAMLLPSRVLLKRSTGWLLCNRRRPLDIAVTVLTSHRVRRRSRSCRRRCSDPARASSRAATLKSS